MDTNAATFTSPATAVLMVYVMVVLAPLASTFNVQLTVVPLLAQPPPGVVARLTAAPVTAYQQLHPRSEFLRQLNRPGAFPESEEASRQVLALPVFPQMTEEQQKVVVDRTAEFVAGGT